MERINRTKYLNELISLRKIAIHSGTRNPRKLLSVTILGILFTQNYG